LPIGYAYHEDVGEEGLEDAIVKMRYRFFTEDGYHYLLFGAKVLDLNAMPPGTIIIDPTVDEQVGASSDDGHEAELFGLMDITANDVYHRANTSSSSRYWAAHRWTSEAFPPQGATIDVAYIELYVSVLYDDINGDWHFEDGASPATLTTTAHDISDRTRTTASAEWAEDSMGTGWSQSPSLVSPLQEVVDSYSPTAIVAIFVPDTSVNKYCKSLSYDSSSSTAAKLHIEYITGAAAAGYSWGQIIG